MPENKTVYVKTRAMCPDGNVRSAYAQLSWRQYDHAKVVGHYKAHVKVDLLSVSGYVYFGTEQVFDDEGRDCTDFFEPHQDGVNADLIPGSWLEFKKAQAQEITN